MSVVKTDDKSFAARSKRFLKAVSAGGVENGIYFKKNKQYFSLVTGIISLIGAIVIISVSTKIYVDILKEKTIASTIEYTSKDVYDYDVKFMQFYDATNLYF